MPSHVILDKVGVAVCGAVCFIPFLFYKDIASKFFRYAGKNLQLVN